MTIRSRVLAAVALAALTACGSGTLPLLPSAGGAGAEAQDSRSSARGMWAPYFSVHYSLSKDFKDDLPDKATAYEFEATTSESSVAKLAKAFGVLGPVKSTKDEWSVTSGGRTLRVSKMSGLQFSLDGDQAVSSGYACAEPAQPSDPTIDPAQSTKEGESSVAPSSPPPDRPDADGDEPGFTDDARCPSPPSANPDLPTKTAAEKIARDALEDGGLDLDGAKVTTDGGYESWNVNVAHRIGDTASNAINSSVLVGPKGRIMAAFGMLARPKAVGDYPLISAAKAVERLNTTHSGGPIPLGAPEPAIARDSGARTDEAKPAEIQIAPAPQDCDDPAVSCVPVPSDQPAPVEPQETREVVLTKASSTLTIVGGYEPNSPLHLVPAFSFTDTDGGEVQVEAVTDEHLQSKQEPTKTSSDPVIEPDHGGGGSGGGGTDGESCSGSGSSESRPPDARGPVNEPLALEVCVADGKVKIGEEVVFKLSAKDADGSFTNGPCQGPVRTTFGDETDDGGAVNCLACAQATEGKHELAETLKHTYSMPGTYKVVFDVHSGSTCDPRPGDSTATIAMAVEVTK